ncbi:hypothetical protein Tco_1447096 [Tanacetum coccineum]
MNVIRVLKIQFQTFINSRFSFDDDDGLMIRNYFLAYTQTEGDERQMQSKEGNVDSSKALDDGLVVTKSSGAKSGKHDTSDISGNDTHVEDADIRPVNDQDPWYQIFNKRTKK